MEQELLTESDYKARGMVPSYTKNEKEKIDAIMKILTDGTLTFAQAKKILSVVGRDLLNRIV